MMANNRIPKAVLVVMLIVFLVPPAWSLARDAVLLVRAGPEGRQDARYILQRDVMRGSSRALEVRSILSKSAPPTNVSAPVIQPVMPRPDLTKALPARDARQLALSPALRTLAVDDARFRRIDKLTSIAEMIALNACVGATPLSRYCANSFRTKQNQVSDQEIIAELQLMGWVAKTPGGVCWNATLARH